MNEQIKINRILPPHELNARRARKRLTQPSVGLKRTAHKPELKSKSKAATDRDADRDPGRCAACSCRTHCKGCTCTCC